MSRPHPEVIATVDAFVRDLDVAQLGAVEGAHATSSYGVVLDAWDRFAGYVATLDAAVRSPLADGAAAVLLTAREGLHGMDAWKLAAWLAHAGEAVAARSK